MIRSVSSLQLGHNIYIYIYVYKNEEHFKNEQRSRDRCCCKNGAKINLNTSGAVS